MSITHGIMARLLLRGMVAGVMAALLGFVFARYLGEPQVDLAIAFEEAHEQIGHAGMSMEPELVSRAVQASWGLLTATLLYGAAFGGVFSIVFATMLGRLRTLSPRMLSFLMGVAGFGIFVAVPTLFYPPNPPAVGNPATIGARTAAYFGIMVLSVSYFAVCFLIARHYASRLGSWNSTLCGAGLFMVLLLATESVLPVFHEVPRDFPASVLWQFREVSLGIQAVIWGGIGLVFGPLAMRVLGRQPELS